MYGVFNMKLLKVILLKVRLLNVSGVEHEIVEDFFFYRVLLN